MTANDSPFTWTEASLGGPAGRYQLITIGSQVFRLDTQAGETCLLMTGPPTRPAVYDIGSSASLLLAWVPVTEPPDPASDGSTS